MDQYAFKLGNRCCLYTTTPYLWVYMNLFVDLECHYPIFSLGYAPYGGQIQQETNAPVATIEFNLTRKQVICRKGVTICKLNSSKNQSNLVSGWFPSTTAVTSMTMALWDMLKLES